MGLVQKETLVVFYIRVPREPERHQPKKERTTGVSSLKPAVNNEQRRKGKEQASSSSFPTGQGQTDVKSSTCLEASLATGAEIPCRWRARRKISSCDFRHPPVCRDYKSGNRCIYGNGCLYRHADGEEKPSKKSKKESTQGAVAILRQKKRSKVVYLKIQIQRSLFCGKLGKRD